MKEAHRFRRHRIARARSAAKPSRFREGARHHPRLPLPAGRDAGPHFAEPISVPLSAHATPCNRDVLDRIRAHAMPVHGYGLN